MKKAGVIVFLLGVALTILTTINSFAKEKTENPENVENTRDQPYRLNWSPIIGIAVMSVGGFLFWGANKK